MHIERLNISGFRCFGPVECTIALQRDLTALIGVNGAGKTALLLALTRMFGVSGDNWNVAARISAGVCCAVTAFIAAAPAPAPAVAPEGIRLEFKRGVIGVSVTWPISAAADCAAWLREVLR